MATQSLYTLIGRLRHAAGDSSKGVPTDGLLLDRWLGDKDQAAFELLLWRHGPLVLATCRRLLRDYHAAEDAFQATWLLFVRKAASVRDPSALAAWLHRTACRVALRARADAARRAACPWPANDVPAPATPYSLAVRDFDEVLDGEIDRLPDHYRRAFILCVLEGKTQAEAADMMGCPRGTLSAWLSRARERLRGRLTRRGLNVTGCVAACLLDSGTGSAAIPSSLIAATVRTAACGSVTPQVLSLTQGALQTMTLTNLKVAVATIAVLGTCGAGMGWLTRGGQAAPTAAAAEVKAKPSQPWPAANEEKRRDEAALVQVRDELRRRQKQAEAVEEMMVDELIRARQEHMELEEQLRKEERGQRDPAADPRCQQLRDEANRIQASMDEILARSVAGDAGAALERLRVRLRQVEGELESRLKELDAVEEARAKPIFNLRKSLIEKEERLRLLERRQAARREEMARGIEAAEAKLRQLEDARAPERADRDLREIVRSLEALRREVADLRQDVQRLRPRRPD
jgi:RNA polymerase sigma factor (sigma-70 family)